MTSAASIDLLLIHPGAARDVFGDRAAGFAVVAPQLWGRPTAEHLVRSIQGRGRHVIGNYVFGLPGDDLISMEKTLNLAIDLRTDFANFHCWPFATRHVDAAAVARFRDAAFATYFTDPAYLARVERNFGSAAFAKVRGMTKERFKRKLATA